MKTAVGFLDRAAYIATASTIPEVHRDRMYDLFELYQKRRPNRAWDVADR